MTVIIGDFDESGHHYQNACTALSFRLQQVFKQMKALCACFKLTPRKIARGIREIY